MIHDEQGERVKTSGTSNPVERTVLNCDKVLASMNREIQERREEELITPYRRVCEEIELFEIGLRSLRGRTQLVAHQLFVQRKRSPPSRIPISAQRSIRPLEDGVPVSPTQRFTYGRTLRKNLKRWD